jgi:hypothetical protein
MITQSRLKQLVSYDRDTGFFYARTSRGGLQAGQQVGWLNGRGYNHIMLDGVAYRSCRLAWLYVHGSWPAGMIDHINGNRTDDRISNLRDCTNAENARNSKISKRNTSGVKGVAWHQGMGKWAASIRVDRKLLHLGYFVDIEDAARVRREAELTYFGDFARVA